MKTVFVVYNQGVSGEISDLFDNLQIRGYTSWQDVHGRGSETGEPRMGTHTWPALNNALLTVVKEEQKNQLLNELKKLDEAMPNQGIRAFVWEAEVGV